MTTMKYVEFREWQNLIEIFRKTLMEAQTHRDEKSQWIDNELGWIIYEREVMFNLTNKEREKRGLNPITMQNIKSCENSACGHVDYTSKFSLSCAELAVGEM